MEFRSVTAGYDLELGFYFVIDAVVCRLLQRFESLTDIADFKISLQIAQLMRIGWSEMTYENVI